MEKQEKQEKVEEKESVWCVLLTRYTDDYKPRGDDWSSTEGPYVFRSREKAEAYLLQKLLEISDEEMHGMDDADTADTKQQLEDAGSDLEAVEEIVEDLVKGEYVVRRWSWELKPVKIES